MASPSSNDAPIKLSKGQHDDILKYISRIYDYLGGGNFNFRAGLEWRDRVYYRENDYTKEEMLARLSNYVGDANKIRNVTVPVVQPQVESTVGYLSEVFCSGSPFFGVVSPPQEQDGALQMETVIDDNSRRFGWRAEAIKCFRDGLKYNLQAAEIDWERKKVFSIINDPSQGMEKGGVAAEEWYSGNFFKRLDLYNVVFDTRVKPNEIHTRGEFAGFVDIYPRTNLKQLVIDLGTDSTNFVTEAFNSNTSGAYTVGANVPGSYYIPLINPAALMNQSNALNHNWVSWFAGVTKNGQIQYRDMYEVAKFYVRAMPSDFNLTHLRARNTPQIFKFIVVNKRWIIYMQRMSNAHNLLPIVVGQPFDDGLGYQAKSYGDNVEPYQAMSSSLWNSGIESKRRLVFDRIFYDPSRINKTDIDKATSVARIPVKASGYGKPVSDAIWSSNYRDDSVVGILQMAKEVQGMAQMSNGLNNVQQGQFQKGNKTRYEFETVMNKSDWHPRLLALTLEDTWFGPIKEIVKMNILQYQGSANLYSVPQQKPVVVNPQVLRKSTYTWKLTDGQTPSEKVASLDLLDKIVQLGMSVPAINAEYDVMGMLTYSIKVAGGSWINDFKRTPDQRAAYLNNVKATTNAETPPEPPIPGNGAAGAPAIQ